MKDTYILIKKAQQGDKKSEDKLVSDNMPLVHSCVRRLKRDGFEYEDLLQVGLLGLIKSIRRFDTGFDVCFSTYAVPVITGDIKRYIRDNTTIKVSRSLKEIYFEISVLKREMSHQLMRDPTLYELSEKSGYSTEKLVMALEACSPCDSLERSLTNDRDESLCLADTLAAESNEVDEVEKIALKSALMKLGRRERKIILLRYFRGKTQAEVSDVIGVSQVQISRIEKKIIEDLRKNLA